MGSLFKKSVVMKNIDLNCDVGEWHPVYHTNNDKNIMPYISSCNVCCGAHSGSLSLSEKTILLAKKHNVAIGAHPSYPDRLHFGRQRLDLTQESLLNNIKKQINDIYNICKEHKVHLNHIKAHGALYSDIGRDSHLSENYVKLIHSVDPNLKLYGMAHTHTSDHCKKLGITYVNEVFADREYLNVKQLKNRSETGAVIHNSEIISKRIIRFLNNELIDQSGLIHPIQADSICIHSDTNNSVKLALSINQTIKNYGFDIRAI